MENKRLDQLVNELLLPVTLNGFDPSFVDKTRSLSSNERFLLKMELQRLTKVCTRPLDQRQFTDALCERVHFAGLNHYLTADAQLQAQELLTQQQQYYTIALYEQMEQYFLSSQKPPEAKQEYIPSLPLAQHFNRKEVRVFLVKELEIINQTGQKIIGHTVNISVSGLRIKLKQVEKLNLGQKLTINFTGFNEGADKPYLNQLEYKIAAIDNAGEHPLIAVQAQNPSEEFVTFLSQFLKQYSGRFRLDMSDIEHNIKVSNCKALVMHQQNCLPLYTLLTQTKPLRYIMSNPHNQQLLEYWNKHQSLNSLFKADRVKFYCNSMANHCLFYCFTFKAKGSEHEFFYCVSDFELEQQPELKTLFFTFGQRLTTWKTFQLTWHPIPEGLKQLSYPIDHIMELSDISNSPIDRIELKPLSKHNFNQLNQFICHPSDYGTTQIINSTPLVHRKELRYAHELKLTLHTDASLVPCVCDNFSVHGLKIQLDDHYDLKMNQEVGLSFDDFNKKLKQYDLNEVVYTVVKLTKDHQLHLKIKPHTKKSDNACLFIEELINQNKTLLNPIKEQPYPYKLARHLSEVCVQLRANRSLILNKRSFELKSHHYLHGPEINAIDWALGLQGGNQQGHINGYFLSHPCITTMIKDIGQLTEVSSSEPNYILLTFDSELDSLQIKMLNEFVSRDKLRRYIEQQTSKASVVILKVTLNLINRHFLSHSQAELNQLSHYAPHLAKECEDAIAEARCFIDLVDLSASFLEQLQVGKVD